MDSEWGVSMLVFPNSESMIYFSTEHYPLHGIRCRGDRVLSVWHIVQHSRIETLSTVVQNSCWYIRHWVKQFDRQGTRSQPSQRSGEGTHPVGFGCVLRKPHKQRGCYCAHWLYHLWGPDKNMSKCEWIDTKELMKGSSQIKLMLWAGLWSSLSPKVSSLVWGSASTSLRRSVSRSCRFVAMKCSNYHCDVLHHSQ